MSESIPMRCPNCNGTEMIRTDEEFVQCVTCHQKVDLYEAIKTAELKLKK